jgi:hypothetical protein
MTRVIEKCREVTIPNVGRMLRVEQQSEDGQLLGDVKYYRPGDTQSPAIDLTLTFVVFVTAASVFITAPSLA